MSSEEINAAGVIFRQLAKRCVSQEDEPIEGAEFEPFTISSRRNFTLDLNLHDENDIDNEVRGGGGTNVFNQHQHQHHHPHEGKTLRLKEGKFLPRVVADKFDFTNLSCRPLEEVDPDYINKQTFLVIGIDGKVHRMSAKKSAFIFNPYKHVRRIGIHILCNWQLPFLMGISLCFFSLSFILPNYASNAVATVTWTFTRYLLGGVLFAEICLNVIARGLLVAEFTYLRSPWDWFDVTIFLIIFINFHWGNILTHSIEGFALLKFIPIVAALKTSFQILVQILKNLVPVLLYSLLTLWILVVVGFHIQSSGDCSPSPSIDDGGISGMVVINGTDNQYQSQRNYNINLPSPSSLAEWNTSMLSNTSRKYCAEKDDGGSPISNITFETVDIFTFKAFGGFLNEIDPLQNQIAYISLCLIFGTFGTNLLSAAAVGLSFMSLRLSKLTTIKDTGTNSKCRSRTHSCLPEFHLPKSKSKCDSCCALNSNSDCSSCANRISDFVFHPFFELCITLVISLDILLIILDQFKSLEVIKFLNITIIKIGQEFCLISCVVELVGKFSSGSKRYLKNWWPLLDLTVVIFYIIDKFFPLNLLLKIRIFRIASRWPILELIIFAIFKALRKAFSILNVLLIGFLSIRIAAVRVVNNVQAGNQSSYLPLPMDISNSFLFQKWSSVQIPCKLYDESLICFVFWFLEISTGIIFGTVIFMSVINCVCDSLSKPSEQCENYERLRKSFQVLKSLLKRSPSSPLEQVAAPMTSSTGQGQRSDSLHPLEMQMHDEYDDVDLNPPMEISIPVPLPFPTSNGSHNHHHPHHHGTIIGNKFPEREGNNNSNGVANENANASRKYSQVSSFFEVVKGFRFQRILSITLICFATVSLILPFDPLQRFSLYKNPRFFIDFLFVCYFILILLWKLVKNNFKSLKSPPWILDFLIISASGFTMYTSILSKLTVRDLGAVKLIATLGYCRGLMLISRLRWLEVAVIGIVSQVRVLRVYLIGLSPLFCYILFLKNTVKLLTVKTPVDDSWLLGYKDEHNENENVTISGSNRGNGVEEGDSFNNTMELELAFPQQVLVLKLGCGLMYIIIAGVLVGVTISELLRNDLLASFMTNAQCATYKDKELNIHREKTLIIPAPKHGLCFQVIHYVTLTNAFDLTVMAIIICDCSVITFQHLATSKDWRIVWSHYPGFIVFTYACELLIKLFGWRKSFFKCKFNIFDSAIVTLGIIDILFIKIHVDFITGDSIRFLRILRIFQLGIITRHAKLLEISYSALLRVAPIVGNLSLLHLLLIYTYSTIGILNFQNLNLNPVNVNASMTFTSLAKSLEIDTESTAAPHSIENVFNQFKSTAVSLIKLPFFVGENSTKGFHSEPEPAPTTAQNDHDHGISFIIYFYSYILISRIILGIIFSVILYEILKELAISIAFYSEKSKFKSPQILQQQKEMSRLKLRNKYKSSNGEGLFLNTDWDHNQLTPDDPDSVATMLTPIEPLSEDPLSDEDRYPLRISANGYVLHVEAIVTTV